MVWGHTEQVTTAAPTISARIHSLNRPNLVSVGTIVWLSSELMFFAGLFAIYFTARAQNEGEWPPYPTELNVPYALGITIILVASSFTCQFGVFAAERGDVFGLRRWYALTLLMGTVFVVGQAYEYYVLVTEHATTLASSAYGTVFYMATGLPRPARRRRSGRLRLPDHPHEALQVHPAAGHRRDRRVVLLALRRRGVGRSVRRHLLHPLTTQ
jgi:cytochrome c oxidase subunit 3